ncbi:unnamed protein product [Boreogadus saida]
MPTSVDGQPTAGAEADSAEIQSHLLVKSDNNKTTPGASVGDTAVSGLRNAPYSGTRKESRKQKQPAAGSGFTGLRAGPACYRVWVHRIESRTSPLPSLGSPDREQDQPATGSGFTG